MLRIEWYGLQASQIVYSSLVGHRSHAHRPCPLALFIYVGKGRQRIDWQGPPHECHKYSVFIGHVHAYRLHAGHVLSAHAHKSQLSPKHYVGKDRQHTCAQGMRSREL